MNSMTGKRIGIDARSYNWTGIGRYIRNVLHGVLAADHENEYVIFLDPKVAAGFAQPIGSRVEIVPVHCGHYSLAEQTTFVRTLWNAKLDLVHFPHFNLPLLYRKPYVVTIHDLTLSFYPGHKMTSLLERAAYRTAISNACRTAKSIIAVSENTKKDIVSVLGVKPEKIRVIYEAVERENYFPTDAATQSAVKSKYKITKPYFLYVGVWRNHKNVVGMIRAFANVVRNGADAQLVITGKPDPHYPEVLETIAQEKIEDRVILPGFVDEQDLPALFGAAQAFVFPSFYEGFGLPPLEAMACGTPVIASSMATMPEILGDAAVYFDPQKIDEMTQCMQSMLSDENLRTTLRAKGLARVDQFDWKTTAQQTHAIYKEVLDAQRS